MYTRESRIYRGSIYYNTSIRLEIRFDGSSHYEAKIFYFGSFYSFVFDVNVSPNKNSLMTYLRLSAVDCIIFQYSICGRTDECKEKHKKKRFYPFSLAVKSSSEFSSCRVLWKSSSSAINSIISKASSSANGFVIINSELAKSLL